MTAKVLVITNINNHYQDPLFRLLQREHSFDFFFYSDGGEPYWSGPLLPVTHLGTTYAGGVWIGRTRFVPRLIVDLARSNHPVVICTAGGKFVLPLVWLFTRIRGRRLVLWTGTWQRPTMAFHRRARVLVDWLMRDADAVVAYGSHVARFLTVGGVEPNRIFLAPRAIDNSVFLAQWSAEALAAYRSSLNLASDDIAILFVGRLVTSKGVSTLIRAFAELARRHSNVHLAIAGSGEDEARLRRLVDQLNIGARVAFIGRVPNAQLPGVFQSADIVVVPSEPTNEGAEPWGIVVNEAMVSGRAIIVSDAVGAAAHGIPSDGNSGYVFAAGDTGALSNALEILVGDEGLRNTFGRAGRVQALQLTYEQMAAGIVAAVNYAVKHQ